MGIENSKNWLCRCNNCGNEFEELAVLKSDFIDILESEGWKITQNGNKAICPNCQAPMNYK